jgi:septal ring factor EnvC (AmiA/AmiB activator)
MKPKHERLLDRLEQVLNSPRWTPEEKNAKLAKIINNAKPVEEKVPEVIFIRVERRKRLAQLSENFNPSMSPAFRTLEYIWTDLDKCKAEMQSRENDYFYKCERVL